MSIYRGPGGSGDATNNATSQAILAAQSAVAAASSEAAAAASAVSASNSASSASTSATNAATSATNAAASATNAANSATSAASSATAAQTAKTAAETAETNAELAEVNAEAAEMSAQAAKDAAITAQGLAQAAETGAVAAKNAAQLSATNAATSESNAAISESDAASSATASASSASAANTSATNAANSASSASTSAATATTQASNAANSATAAATSASNAATSETNAANSASSAAASASTATTQATNAANSATSASSSASSAAASAAAAAASYDNFDDRYLGTKSTAPTLDNDGNALVTGALYYNDGTSVLDDKGMWVYDGAQWLPASAAAQAILVTYDYTATSGQTTFTGADNNAVTLSYTPGSLIVTINGVVLDQSDYTATNGTSVVLASGATAGDEVNILAFSTFDVANTYTKAEADAKYLLNLNPSYTGTLTGGTGVINIGSGQIVKDTAGNLGLGVTPSAWYSGWKAVEIGAGNAVWTVSNQDFRMSSNLYNDGSNSVYKANGYATYYNQQSGTHKWYTAPSGTAGNAISFTQAMTLDASGNLGIGTSSPQNKFVVSSGGAQGIEFVPNDSGGNSVLSYNRSVAAWNQLNLKGSLLAFFNAGSEAMRIDSSGNLFLGATAYTYSNSNSILFGGPVTASQVVVQHINGSASGSAYAAFVYNGGEIGSIKQNGTTQVAYNTSSDYRLKENIQPMQNGLAFCRKQRPVTYNWKSDGSKGSGYIAHWMQEDGAGNCVTGEKDAVDKDGKPIYQGIDTSFMVGPLNAGLNELADIVDKQAELLAQLKAELDTTKAEVAALKGN